jgi:hypothetical protein
MSSNKRKTCYTVDGDNDDAMTNGATANSNHANAMITNTTNNKCNSNTARNTAQAVDALLQERCEAHQQRLDDIERRLVATQYASQCFSRYIDIHRRRQQQADTTYCPTAVSAQEICLIHHDDNDHDHDRGTSHDDNNAMFWKFRRELSCEHDVHDADSSSIQLLNQCLGDYGLAVDLDATFPTLIQDYCGFSKCHYDQLRVCRSSKQAATNKASSSSSSSSPLCITVTGAALEAINGAYYECITDCDDDDVGRMDGVSKFLAKHRTYMGQDDTTFTMHRCTTWDGGKEWIISMLAEDNIPTNTHNSTPSICEKGADVDFFKAPGTTASKPSGNIGEACQNMSRIQSHGSHLPPPSGWEAISKSTSTKEEPQQQQSQLLTVDASQFCPVCRTPPAQCKRLM